MNADFVICIPSYHRSQSIKQNTLKTLDDCGIPHNLIKVFVSREEIPTYRESLPADIEIIEGALGCIENRAKIREHYPEGQNIVYMDDDIKGIYSVCDMTDEHATCYKYSKANLKTESYIKQIPIPNLKKFFLDAFQIMKKEGAHLAGIYPVANGFFCSHKYTTDLRYFCGFFYLEINVKDFALEGDQYSEDFERSCVAYKRDGKVIRFEYVCAKTDFYKGSGDNGTPGGLVESRTVELSRQAVVKLQRMYPSMLRIVEPTKNNRFWNLKILKQKKVSFQSSESEP